MIKQWKPPMCGTLRISNPKTLEKWLQNGNYQKEIDAGWIFSYGCGRFRIKPCTCSKCKRKVNLKDSPLGKLLISYKRKHYEGTTSFI